MPECFASVLMLAHRHFHTEVPGLLLAVSKLKGEGKGKGKMNERGMMNWRGCIATMVLVVVDPVAEANKMWVGIVMGGIDLLGLVRVVAGLGLGWRYSTLPMTHTQILGLVGF